MHGEPERRLRGVKIYSTREPDPDNTGGGIAIIITQILPVPEGLCF
jgi:hypothetical protein